MCPFGDGRVGMPGYDSIHVVHVCILDKESICFQKDWEHVYGVEVLAHVLEIPHKVGFGL